MKQQFPLGNLGTVDFEEKGGVFTLGLTISKKVGGGALEGFISVEESLKLSGNGPQVVDAALLLAEQKWPNLTPEIAPAKVLIDAFLATL